MTTAPSSSRTSVARHLGAGLGLELAIYPAAALSLAAAMIHLWVVPDHLGEWWGYGFFFLFVALAQGLYGVVLLRWPERRLLLAGVAGNLALISLFVSMHTAGLPLGPHTGEAHPVDALGISATASELALVLLLLALARGFSSTRAYLLPATLLAFGTGAVLHALHAGMPEAHAPAPLLHWAWVSVLALPLSGLVVWSVSPLARRAVAASGLRDGLSANVVWALGLAAAYGVLSVPTNGLAMRHTTPETFLAQALGDAGAVLGAGFLILLGFAALRGLPWEEPKVVGFWRPRTAAVVAGLAAAVAVVFGLGFFEGFSRPAEAQAAPACSAASYDRSYSVAAVNVAIPFNRWGDLDPDGQVYVLQGDKLATKNWFRPLAANAADDPAGNRRLRPRPLILRANAGECIKINFKNELSPTQWSGRLVNPRASMQVRGMAYDAKTSDGGAVGFNKDTTVGIGQSTTYFWQAPNEEGLHLFRSQTMTSGEEEDAGSNAHGLYGAVAVEPAGSRWTDPETGQPLYNGTTNHTRVTKSSGDPYVDADIRPVGAASFRESVQLAQDYNEVQPGLVGHGFNYGTEPQRNREEAGRLPADGLGEEVSLSSWGYGDPSLVKLASGKATRESPWEPGREDCGLEAKLAGKGSCYVANVTHSYVGDPTKIRYAMAGVAETHVFHLHAHQWLANPKDKATFNPRNPNSSTLDSQTFGPGETFTADLLYGAGSQPGTFGDSIFHCHLYPHFAEGFWSLLRVHDVYENGTGKTPDGTKVRQLVKLPDRTAPPRPTVDNPGFPRFIPGEYGWRAPQPPGSVQEPDPNNPDQKVAATRVVAGKALDPAQLDLTDPLEKRLAEKLEVEEQVRRRSNGGSLGEPGAPFADPCPPGAREVTYNVSVMQRDIVYNEAGWHDTQGRFLVLDKDVPRMLARNPNGSYRNQPEPLFVRVNAGDCVNFNLTNLLPNWFGGDAFVRLTQTNMMGQHIHLVKFDVLASDGASNGWNYQQAAFTEEQMNFNRQVASGQRSCDEANGCTLPNPATWNPSWSGGVQPGQTIRERWYADYELRTAFSHDHHFPAIDQNRGQFAGLLVEPAGMNFRNPRTGEFYQPGNGNVPGAPNCPAAQGCEGDAAGAAMDVIGPGARDDFREYGLAYQDFVSLTRAGGNPANRNDVFVGPNAPESYPDEDPGIVGINYRNAPFPLRQDRDGQRTDPAHVFSSTVHGDPATPVLEAYAEDPVQVRLIQGSQEHQHTFSINGMRWREDVEDPRSPLVASQDVGISEAFNFRVPKIECGANAESCVGDYLYSSQNVDDLYMGMWGILRARGSRVPSLLPLPDNVPPAGPQAPTPSAVTPPGSSSPGNPCKVGAPTRKFSVVALEKKLVYNKQGDNDPYGLIYALSRPGETANQTVARVRAEKKTEPMVLRANAGDCIEVRLTNKLTSNFLRHGNAGTDGDAQPPLEPDTGTRAGLRVSLNPQLVKYDVRGSDGTAVGYNRDQTVGPDESRLYRWYADGELGTINLTDFGDVRAHRHHGLFAGLTIEPKGATYHDPLTGKKIQSGVSADIRVPGKNNDFREFTAFFQDGLNLRDRSGAPIEESSDPNEPPGQANDHIDQGEKGFNYGTAQFRHRFGGREAGEATAANPMNGREMANVYSSRVHGDPDTPVFRAYAGDRVRMRVLQGADKQRQHSFEQLGHAWNVFPGDPGSPRVAVQGGMSVSRALNVHLRSAGNGYAGDYRYADGMYRHNLSGGLWGLMRVYTRPSAAAALSPSPLRSPDNPLASSYHPLMPLETSATSPAKAKSAVSLKSSSASVKRGRIVTLSGAVKPRHGGKVKLVIKRGGQTVVNRSLSLKNSRYSFRHKAGPPGVYTVRASFAGDRDHRPSKSPAKEFRVTR